MQQYDQRRLRLFAVVLFLGIMAANLGRYTQITGLKICTDLNQFLFGFPTHSRTFF